MIGHFSSKKDSKAAAANKSDDEDDVDDLPVEGIPIPTKYEFAEVDVPADFLSCDKPPYDARPTTARLIDWRATPLPENDGRFAAVLDGVLSPSECATLLRLAEASVPEAARGKKGTRFWRPALVNVGGGLEVLEPDYRNSDRIIWDHQGVADRLWERCMRVPGEAGDALRARLAVVEDDTAVLGLLPKKSLATLLKESKGRGKGKGAAATATGTGTAEMASQRWEFRRLNKRLRFLKYGPGQFFRPHCDGEYREPGGDKVVKTLFTLHLYLNDSKAEAEAADEDEDSKEKEAGLLVGGATSFLSGDERRRVDVDPKAGRVLIFQHRGLYHAGDDVLQGVKYTMRTDVMYELVRSTV